MTRTRPVQNTFSAGEIDPLLQSRNDFQRWQTGLRACVGFVPLRQGGVTRAPGTLFRGTTRLNLPARRIPFQFAANDSLSLEFTDLKMRVWRYGALVLDGAGDPYELDTPYTQADLPNLDWTQDADVIFLADGRQPIQQLSRFALDNWTIAPAVLENGPFRVQNLDEAKTIAPSAAAGTITLTATGGVFEAGHVGALFQLEPTDFTDVALWVGNADVAANVLMRFDGNIYQLTAGTNTGVNPPVHSEGAVRTDGSKPTEWTFVSTEIGIVRITAVTDANTATAEVIKTLPKPVVDDPTHRWSEGAWSDKHGYPSRITNYQQRLFAARTPSDPRTLWASTQGLLRDFEPSAEADGSFAFAISGNGSRNEILWLMPGRRGIYIGALGEVHRGFSAQAGEAIGPLTFDTDLVAADGVSPALPIVPYGDPLYITSDRGRAQEIRFSFEEDGSRPIEMSLPSQHLGGPGFEQIVWQSAPYRRAWLRRSDGTLVVMLHDPEQDVLGWAPVPVAGGFVEDMDITKSLDGAFDVLTMIVRREIDGQTVRFVEEQSVNFRALLGSEPITHFNHAFAAALFQPEAPTVAFDLPHLIGQTVHAWTDRGDFGPFTVSPDGTVELPEPVGRAVIGLLDETHHFETLNLTAAGREGDTRGIRRRLHAPTGIEVYRTVGGTVRSVERHFGQPDILGAPQQIVPRGVALDIQAAVSGTTRLATPSGHTDAVHLRVEPRGLSPLTVTALVETIDEAGP